jgi:hypothetical protein
LKSFQAGDQGRSRYTLLLERRGKNRQLGGGEMKTGLTAGSGMLLGLMVGTIFFSNPALGMIFGMLLGGAVAAARRRRSGAPPSH